MQSNSLRNPVRPRLALRRAEGPALPASGFRSPVDSTGVPTPDLSGAEVEPCCGRERSKSRRACPERSRRTKSRAQPREPKGPALLACTACPEESRRERSRRACPACPERTRGKRSRRERSERACAEQSECVPVAWPLGHKLPIINRFPLLLPNRGYAELEILPSPCKQRATLLSNRGKTRVVKPLRGPSRTTHPSSLPFSHPYAGWPILPASLASVGIDLECGGLPPLFWTVPPASNFLPPTPFLIATRTYSPEKLTHRKYRVIRFSSRHKIHSCTERSERGVFDLHPGGDGAGSRMPSDECRVPGKFNSAAGCAAAGALLYRNREANRCLHCLSRAEQREAERMWT